MVANQYPTTTWSWRPEVGPRLRRNIWAAGIGIVLASAVCAGIAIATPTRFVVVLTVLLASIGVIWWREHRRFRATELTIDGAGMCRVDDGRQSGSIDLQRVDSVAVRLRTQPGISILSSTPRWTIELAGSGVTLTHRIAHAAGLFNPDTADVERLEAELTAHVERWSGLLATAGRSSQSTRVSGSGASPASSDGDASGSLDALGAPIGRFEWRPPISPSADRRRRWYRIAYIGAALLVAILGVVSARGDWVGVILSAVTVPGMILAFCGGLDWALGRARRFRLFVDGGVLHVEPAGSAKRIELRSATVSVDRNAQFVATGTTTTRATTWRLSVTAADGSSLVQVLPSFGTVAREADYVALERELRRRT